MKKYRTDFSKEELHAALHAHDNEAITIIEDKNKWENFREKFEAFLKKAEKIPVLGGMIDDIVCMVALVDSYVKKEYRDIPVATIVSIAAALIYLLSPIDIIPDAIPFIGYIDDAAVVLSVLNFGVDADLDKYRLWQEENRKAALDGFERLLAEELSEVIADGYLAAVILCEDNRIKLLISSDQDSGMSAECMVREVKVPVKALADYDVEEAEEILSVLGETIVRSNINWMNGTEKRAYMEADFEAGKKEGQINVSV